MLRGRRLIFTFFVLFFLSSTLFSGSLFKAPPAFKPEKVVFLPNEKFFDVLRDRINSAQSEIVIVAFLFKTYNDPTKRPDIILDELGKAIRRGVRVRVIFELGPKEKKSSLDERNMETATKLIDKGADVMFDPPNVVTHCKIVVIDKKYVFIGSHNFTQSGLLYNNEASLMVVSPELASDVLKYIDSIAQE